MYEIDPTINLIFPLIDHRVLRVPGTPQVREMVSTSSQWLVWTSKIYSTLNATLDADSTPSTVIPLQNATVGGVVHAPITYFETFPFPITQALPIFATSNDTTVIDDACNPLPPSVPDLSKFLVLVRRGTCTFVSGSPLCSSHS